jgi:O-acetyl-ADP-ribose deacetylase (regulator of RNase III)
VVASLGSLNPRIDLKCRGHRQQQGFASVALPIIGAGSGGFAEQHAQEIMLDVLAGAASVATATVVRFR